MRYRVHIEMSRDGYPLRLQTTLLVGGSSQGVAKARAWPKPERRSWHGSSTRSATTSGCTMWRSLANAKRHCKGLGAGHAAL